MRAAGRQAWVHQEAGIKNGAGSCKHCGCRNEGGCLRLLRRQCQERQRIQSDRGAFIQCFAVQKWDHRLPLAPSDNQRQGMQRHAGATLLGKQEAHACTSALQARGTRVLQRLASNRHKYAATLGKQSLLKN